MQGDDLNPSAPEVNWQFKPGDTITPGQTIAPSAVQETAPSPLQPLESVTPQAITPEAEVPAPTPATDVTAQNPATHDDTIQWTASEFIAHHKSVGWYLLLGLAALGVAAAIWLLTKDKISASVVVVAAIALGAYGARKPRQLAYELDESGLQIGDKYYAFDDFRSFAIIPEGAFSSIVFMPLKRFAPLTTIYYEPADEIRIVDLLSDRLPMEERQHDAVDRFLRRIRY